MSNELEEEVVVVVLPDAPRCKKCGHMMCPECRTWCDVLEGPNNDLCCDGACDVDPIELALWEEKMKAIDIPEFARIVYESEQKALVEGEEGKGGKGGGNGKKARTL